MSDVFPAQIEMTDIMAQVPETPTVMVISLSLDSPPQRLFLKKHLELLPWEKI